MRAADPADEPALHDLLSHGVPAEILQAPKDKLEYIKCLLLTLNAAFDGWWRWADLEPPTEEFEAQVLDLILAGVAENQASPLIRAEFVQSIRSRRLNHD